MYALVATFSVWLSWNLVRMFVLIKSWKSSNMGNMGLKTRSLGQILEKPCVCFRGHIFSDYHKTWYECLSWNLRQVPKWVMSGQKLGHSIRSQENLVYASEATFSVRLSWNLVRMFVLIKSWGSSKKDHVGSKTSSLDQILKKPCVRCRDLITVRLLWNLEVWKWVMLDQKLGH